MSESPTPPQSIWQGVSFQDGPTYHSPLRYHFTYPKNWTPEAVRSSVILHAPEVPFSPLVVFTAIVREESLNSLQSHMIEQLQNDPKIHVVTTRFLSTPRPAAVIEVLYQADQERSIRREYTCSLHDQGNLSLVFVTSDWENDSRDRISESDPRLTPWRQSEINFPVVTPSYQWAALESRKFAFEFPSNWVVQLLSDDRIELRAAIRSSFLPNIVIESGALTAPSSFEQLCEETRSSIQQLSDVRNLAQEEIQIGNRHGISFRYEILNQNQQMDQVIAIIVKPISDIWNRVTLSGLSERWVEYDAIFRRIQASFIFLP